MKGTAVLFHVSEGNGIMHSLIVFLYTPLLFIPTLHFAASGFLNIELGKMKVVFVVSLFALSLLVLVHLT